MTNRILQRSTYVRVSLVRTMARAISLPSASTNVSVRTEQRDSTVRQVGGIHNCVIRTLNVMQ